MRIRITSKASKQLKRISKFDQIAIAKKIRGISIKNAIKVKGYEKLFRARVGSYRIVFSDEGSFYMIVLIGHRKDVYKLLNQMNLM